MSSLIPLLLCGLAMGQDAEPVELVRARFSQKLVVGLIPTDLEQGTLTWDPSDADASVEGKPFAVLPYQATSAERVVNVQAKSKVTGVTPVVFLQDPSGEPVQLGDLSPNAGESDAWLRLHAAGEWLVLVLADTAGAQGEVDVTLFGYDTSDMGTPYGLGTMLQTEAGASGASQASSGSGAASSSGGDGQIVQSELDASDPTTDAGDYYEVFGFEVAAGERIRLAAVSDHYDLIMLLEPPDEEAISAESSGLAGSPALLDHTAKSSGEATLAVFAKEGNPTGDYEFLAVRELSGDLCQQLSTYEVADAWQLEGIEDARTADVMRTRTLLDTMAFAQTCSVDKFAMDLGVSCTIPAADGTSAKAIFEPLAAEFRSCNAGWEISEHPSGNDLSIYAVKDGRTRTLTISEGALTGWSVRAGTYASK